MSSDNGVIWQCTCGERGTANINHTCKPPEWVSLEAAALREQIASLTAELEREREMAQARYEQYVDTLGKYSGAVIRIIELEQERDSALNDQSNWRYHALICTRPAKEVQEEIAALRARIAELEGENKALRESAQDHIDEAEGRQW